MRTILGAVSFLTTLPVRSKPVPLGRAAILFPLVGAAIGALGGSIFIDARRYLPWWLAALLTVVFWVGISRIPLEDGALNVVDVGLASSKSRRIGAFGMIAIALSFLARWQALDDLTTAGVWEVMIASQAVPRAAMVALAWMSRPSGTKLGFEISSTLSTWAAIAAIAQGVAAALLCGLRPGILILAGSYLVLRGAQMYFYRRDGGVQADSLGVTEQILEIYILVLFACRACS